MNKYLDIRVVGQESELKEFVDLCKMIQCLGRKGANRTIKLTVDGDGSGRLAFYGILKDKFTEFNSSGFNVDKVEELDMWIGE